MTVRRCVRPRFSKFALLTQSAVSVRPKTSCTLSDAVIRASCSNGLKITVIFIDQFKMYHSSWGTQRFVASVVSCQCDQFVNKNNKFHKSSQIKSTKFNSLSPSTWLALFPKQQSRQTLLKVSMVSKSVKSNMSKVQHYHRTLPHSFQRFPLGSHLRNRPLATPGTKSTNVCFVVVVAGADSCAISSWPVCTFCGPGCCCRWWQIVTGSCLPVFFLLW